MPRQRKKEKRCSYRTAIESFISTNPGQSIKRRVLIVCLWFFTTLIGAVFLPNISLAIHYLGALAASFIFIFPGTFSLYLFYNNFTHPSLLQVSVYTFISNNHGCIPGKMCSPYPLQYSMLLWVCL